MNEINTIKNFPYSYSAQVHVNIDCICHALQRFDYDVTLRDLWRKTDHTNKTASVQWHALDKLRQYY